MSTIELGLALLLFHLLYDFHWQGDYVSGEKGRSDLILTVHALTWTLFTYIPLYYVEREVNLWALAFLFVTHWAMDRLKARGILDRILNIDQFRADFPRTRPNTFPLFIDQAFHLATLAIVLFWVT